MKMTETAIRRGIAFFMIYLIAVGFGLFSLGRLDIDLYPKLEFPVIALISQYTGVGPFDIETVVTRPIEEVVASVENVEKITSTSAQGLSLVLLEFDWGTDMNQAEIDVRNNLEFIKDVLPDEISGPLVFAFDPSTQPILYLALSSETHGQAELRRIAERDLEPRLERIPGVASAFTMGGMRREIKILVDPARLRACNIPIQQVSTALQMGNLQLPAGKIDNPRQELTIQTAGEFASIEEIENTSVAAMNGTVIRVKDVATVIDGFVEQQQKVWNNGEPAVMVMIQKQSDANTLNVCREVRNRFAKIEAELPKGVRIETVVDFSEFITRSMSNLGNKIGGWLDNLKSAYAKRLAWSLQHRKTVIFSAAGLFILSIITLASLGGEFLPKSDSGFVAIAVDTAPGTSLEAMETSMRQIDGIIRAHVPEAKNAYINFGQGEGVMAFFSSRTSSEGDVTLGLTKLTMRKRTQFDIEDDLRERFKKLPGVEARFADRGQEAMFGGGTDVAVEIFGHDLSRAEALVNAIKEKVAGVQGVVDVETSLREAAPELKINFDRHRLADLGLSAAQISQLVSTNILGSVVTRYRDQGDEYDVRVQLAKEARKSKDDIESIMVVTPSGRQIPLRAVAEVEYRRAPGEIIREGQERMVSVNIDISGRDLRSVTRDVEKALREVTVPNDFRLEIGGLALLAALLLVYMVMASQFESLLDPFIIIFTIPLSLIGVAIALLLTGTNLNVMALIGIIMLVGIVVNNGIVLVDYMNQLRARGKELFEAIIEAGQVRLRLVLMTALTTILAMLPLALGLGESGENWAPMARAVMGGLTAATVLTLIVVPVIYAIVEKAERIRQKREARAKAKVQFVAA